MKIVTLLLTLTTALAINTNDCNEIGKYKDKVIFICSTVFASPSSSITKNVPSPSIIESSPSPSIIESSPSFSPSPSIMESSPSPSIMESSPSPSVVESSPSPSVVESSPSPSVVESSPSPSISVMESSPSPSNIETSLPNDDSSIENIDTYYNSFNTTNDSDVVVVVNDVLTINKTFNVTNITKNQLVEPIGSFNIGIIIVPFLTIFLFFLFYCLCRKRSSQKICDSSKTDDLPVISIKNNNVEMDTNSDNSNETIPSPPTAPITLPSAPSYDIENPPPVPPRSENVQSIVN